MKRICVVGLGYIGLPTAILVARTGCKVVGVDTNQEVVKMLNIGFSHLGEEDVASLLSEVINSGTLRASNEPEEADAYIIAVPTPLGKGMHADLRYVTSAANAIAPYLKRYAVVIVESTVPPSTCERVLIPCLEGRGLKAGEDFDVVYCPERAMPSNLIKEMIYNDRIIGAPNAKAADAAKALYSRFVKGAIHVTTVRTAEMCKVMENAYRDVNIALANEIALISEELEINVWEAIELANKHPRVDILKPGPGVGGHCIAVDPWFLCSDTAQGDLIRTARLVNDAMPRHVMKIVRQMVSADPPHITLFGIAYKGEVNDVRESPSLKMIEIAEGAGWDVRVYDPVVKHAHKYPLFALENAVRDSDIVILATDHSAFTEIEPAAFGQLMRQRNVLDTRNVLSKEKWEQAGFTYRLLGGGAPLCH
jgi:UDP-N-acetyl-D-mannosaminuronic acid dehydrogenase